MKFNLNNKYTKWGITAFLVVVASICFYYLLFHASALKAGMKMLLSLVMPIIVGFIIAYLLTPILNYTEQHILIPLADLCKIKESKKRKSIIRGIGIALTSCFILAIICLLVAMLLSQIVPSVMNIVSNFDSYIGNLSHWLDNLWKDNPELGDYAEKTINKYFGEFEIWFNETVLNKASSLLKTLSVSILSSVSGLWDFIIGFIIAVYVLASKEKFIGQAKKIAYALFEKKTANTVIRNFRYTHKTFIGFVSGKILDSFIIGVLCFVGTTLIKTPYAALVSVVIGITNIIPFFGPFLGAIPCSILIFVIDPLHPLNCLYFVIFIFILQQFDGNILGPKILGESTGLAGFWVIFSITLFGGLFGIVGMVIGVPVFAIIYASIKSLVNTALAKKRMTYMTEEYVQLEYVDEKGVFHQKEEKVISTPDKKETMEKKE